MKIVNCKVNHLENPLGYYMDHTVFSWMVEESSGKRQAGARIQVWSNGAVAADTGWAHLDSLAAMVEIKLCPRTRYLWKVSVRTDAGDEAQSEENWFETGKMEEPWQAEWIGCDDSETRHPVFSKEICPGGDVVSARLYICGLGLYEACWNGEKIGGEYLAPYCNNYNAWVQYQTFDMTECFQQSGVLSVELGNGWYNGRFGLDKNPKPYYGDGKKMIAEAVLVYADGTTQTIGTDGSWRVGRSPVTFSNIYDGEWREDILPAVRPVPAVSVEPPKGKLTARYSTPVEVRESLPVKDIIHTPAGETVIDVGQNMTGIFRLSLHEPKGARIRLQFGEILQDGNFYRENLRTAKAEYVYISDGEPHVLEPRFTFYGYRYVKVEGIENLKAEDFTALVLYSGLPQTGWLETGSPLVNRLVSNVDWGQRGNFLDVPTDCPQRDERMGWTGDAQVFSGTACYLRDSWAFYAKYLHDMETEQQAKDGAVPDVVPGFGKDSVSAAWGDAACVIPMKLYEMYGDKSILERQYGSMKAWVEYIRRSDGENSGWRNRFHYGDWLALDGVGMNAMRGGTETGYVADTQYRHSVLLLARAAEILNQDEDAAEYNRLAKTLLERIREEYFTPSGRCAVPTQTGYLLALCDGNAPKPDKIAAALKQNLENNSGKLQTGFVGTPLLCSVLTEYGNDKAAFDLLLNEEYPGWLYAVKLGATTVWERWNSVDENGKIAENGMNSLNHYAYGSILEWLYRDVAGIAPETPGFRKARLAPHMSIELGKVEASYRSAAGTWKVKWEILENGDIAYHCVVPFGCSAKLRLPYGGGEHNLEAGSFRLTYTPDTALRKKYSTDSTLQELFANPKTKALLTKMLPGIAQLPPGMMGLTMRALAAKTGVPEKVLEQADGMLGKI